MRNFILVQVIKSKLWVRVAFIALCTGVAWIIIGQSSRFGVDLSLFVWIFSALLIWGMLGRKALHLVTVGLVFGLVCSTLAQWQRVSNELGNFLFVTLALGVLVECWQYSRSLWAKE